MYNARRTAPDHDPDQADRLSVLLARLDTGEGSTIGAVVDSLGGQAFGATMFVFAAPNLVPNPPGTSPILGLPLLFLAVQLMLGRETVWLPAWLRRRPLSRQFLSVLARRVAPVVARMEAVLAPRLRGAVSPGPARQLVGAVALPLAAILLLPLPFLHMLPGAAMTAFAAGLAEEDGLAIATGYVLALVSGGAFLALGYAVNWGLASILP